MLQVNSISYSAAFVSELIWCIQGVEWQYGVRGERRFKAGQGRERGGKDGEEREGGTAESTVVLVVSL